ncbi:ABC transporter permease [Demequina zhanjiangensis]|uniref:ABC transporter permease n=1 Tax=Demequina zhanjiangensis TaxID=3051659 RepID=A0ABT8G4M7_9MICO|nr:ABC transporter permease [Demequina sp. SYSU T00b26]MDN4474063.1 ABC transporter permease [Demequina sp. SYSU T00b26]
MTRFIFKRLGIALGVLLAATYLFFLLAANAGDPLEDLRASNQQNREELIAARTAELNLDVPVPVRYFYWAADAVTGDLGTDYRTGQEVTEMIGKASGQTLKLIGFSSVAAIVLGVMIGVISALRQYTGFDYGVTVVNFLLYSLPSFWVAVLLKQWGAIGFNDFLADPTIPPLALLIIGGVLGVVVGAAVGGAWKSRLIVGGTTAVLTMAVLAFMSWSGWFLDPSLGPVVILILGVGFALAVTFLAAGLNNRKALYTSLVMAAVGGIAWWPMQMAFGYTDGLVAFIQLIGFIVAGYVVGLLFRGPDKKISARVGAITGGLVYGLLWLDYLMSWWLPYTETSTINGRPIATVGSSTPQLADNTNYWVGTIDTYTHMILPIMAIILISLAGYTRYMRGSMLEVMNLDYIRTARAKGLPERTVVMRHGFRNALIPLATIIPVDLASLIGGAVITETVFGWNGMGKLFVTALREVNTNVLMGYFLVTGVLLVIGNMIADILYAVLDPRIRVDA